MFDPLRFNYEQSNMFSDISGFICSLIFHKIINTNQIQVQGMQFHKLEYSTSPWPRNEVVRKTKKNIKTNANRLILRIFQNLDIEEWYTRINRSNYSGLYVSRKLIKINRSIKQYIFTPNMSVRINNNYFNA